MRARIQIQMFSGRCFRLAKFIDNDTEKYELFAVFGVLWLLKESAHQLHAHRVLWCIMGFLLLLFQSF